MHRVSFFSYNSKKTIRYQHLKTSLHRTYRDVQVKKINSAAAVQFPSFHAPTHSEPPETGRLPQLRELKPGLMKGLSIVRSCHRDWQITSWVTKPKPAAAGADKLTKLPLAGCCAPRSAGAQSQSLLTELSHRAN